MYLLKFIALNNEYLMEGIYYDLQKFNYII